MESWHGIGFAGISVLLGVDQENLKAKIKSLHMEGMFMLL